VGFLQEIGPRGKVLHFKDGHITDRSIEPPFLPAGQGEVDLITAARGSQGCQIHSSRTRRIRWRYAQRG
jgi:hypothetical protein